MQEIAERVGFPGIIVIRNGMEGTIAFPLKRPAKILCSARQGNGGYVRTELEINPVQFLDDEPAVEERQENPSLQENIRLIQEFAQYGKTANRLFDGRIKVTSAGLTQAINWLNQKTGRPVL